MIEPISTPNSNDDDRVVNFLVALAGAWKLLLVAPLLVGISTVVAGNLLKSGQGPQNYRSQATIFSEGFYGDGDDAINEIRRILTTRDLLGEQQTWIGTSPDILNGIRIMSLGDNLYRIEVKQQSPYSPQKILATLLADSGAFIATLDERRVALFEQTLQATEDSLERRQAVYETGIRLLSGDAVGISSPVEDAGLMWNSLVKLTEDIDSRKRVIVEGRRAIAEYKKSEVVEAPAADVLASPPQISTTRLGILAGLLTWLVLLFAVFTRQQWRRLRRNPRFSTNIKRIIDAF